MSAQSFHLHDLCRPAPLIVVSADYFLGAITEDTTNISWSGFTVLRMRLGQVDMMFVLCLVVIALVRLCKWCYMLFVMGSRLHLLASTDGTCYSSVRSNSARPRSRDIAPPPNPSTNPWQVHGLSRLGTLRTATSESSSPPPPPFLYFSSHLPAAHETCHIQRRTRSR